MKKVWIAAGIIVSSAAMLLIYFLDIPHWEKLDISRVTSARAASVLLDENGEEVTLLAGTATHIPIAADDIPLIVKQAFVAAEDGRFYAHHGVDIRRIFGALIQDVKTLSLREGASTITQQLIKLTHLDGRKTFSRKANEAYLALQLERKLSKDEILTAYLNIVYFGQGAYGIESASRVYYGKSARALTLSEAATLAGIVQSPGANNPIQSPEKAASRRAYVLARMKEDGYISEEEAGLAQAVSLPEAQAKATENHCDWYRDEVINEACRLLAISADELLSGGYSIQTGLDPRAQAVADQLFSDASAFPADAKDGTKVETAFCAVDPLSGEIRALIGGREYVTARGLNRATQSRRQPGSTIKPVSVYAAAVDAMGLSPSSVLDDTPRTFAGGYTPVNAAGHYYGLVTLRTALSKSLNVASVSLIEFTGVGLARQYAQNAGLRLDDSDNGLSLALGGLTYGVTPSELCGAYAMLANGGKAVTPHTIRRIADRNGKTLYEFLPSSRTVMSAESAYMITSMLETAAQEGSGKALRNAGVPIAGKTGTAAQSGTANRDIWTAAYTPDWAACVWMGFDQTDENHVLPASESGSGRPARILASFFSKVASGQEFAIPSDLKRVSVDKSALENAQRLLLAPSNAPSELVTTEIFRQGQEPKEDSTAFDVPKRITDFQGEALSGGKARLYFTALNDGVDYLILREEGDTKQVCAQIGGAKGEILEYVDEMPGSLCVYSVIGRNRLLYEHGVTSLSEESPKVTIYRNEGFLKRIEMLFGR